MSGLDEEFRNREIFAEKILYDTRLNSILDTLGNVMTDFGGKGKAVQQRLSDPLSRHVGHQRGAAPGRQSGEVDACPQGVFGIGAGQDLRPRPGRRAGTRR